MSTSKTHRFFLDNKTMHSDDIGVLKLAHDDSFLEKSHFIFIVGVRLQSLDCYSGLLAIMTPVSFVNLTKLARPKVFAQSARGTFIYEVSSNYTSI